MNCKSLALVLVTAVTATLSSSKKVEAQNLLSSLLGTPVAISYTCPTTTGSLPTCSTNFTLSSKQRLVIQSVSGSATPLNPTATGTFPTTQANLVITTQLYYGGPIANIIGPNYAITGGNTWFFNTPDMLYSDSVPVVANNGGPVYLQGYLIPR